jgi:hypothetical protein
MLVLVVHIFGDFAFWMLSWVASPLFLPMDWLFG